MAVGACETSAFEMRTAPKNKYQDHWDEQCYVCQAFAYELEERVHLTRFLTERTIIPVVQSTCERLVLNYSLIIVVTILVTPFHSSQ